MRTSAHSASTRCPFPRSAATCRASTRAAIAPETLSSTCRLLGEQRMRQQNPLLPEVPLSGKCMRPFL